MERIEEKKDREKCKSPTSTGSIPENLQVTEETITENTTGEVTGPADELVSECVNNSEQQNNEMKEKARVTSSVPANNNCLPVNSDEMVQSLSGHKYEDKNVPSTSASNPSKDDIDFEMIKTVTLSRTGDEASDKTNGYPSATLNVTSSDGETDDDSDSEFENIHQQNLNDYFLNVNDEDFDAYEAFMTMLEERRERNHAQDDEPIEPFYPHHPIRKMECQICYETSDFRSRFCCRFKACNECVNTYIEMKVQEAKVVIECPNDKCNGHIHKIEIRDRLSEDMKNKYDKFMVDANKDPCKKTCPSCSTVHSIDPDVLSARKKLKRGLEVQCSFCKQIWCFLCQAPFHHGITCKDYIKGDEMLRHWAKESCQGKANAQRCPKCKTYIQKSDGCDHMKCAQCATDFCYRCGEKYIRIKFIGNHYSRYSLFGCKYRLLPQKPVLRKFIRGSNFAARVFGCIVLGGLGLAAGVGLLGASVFILPGYGVVKLRRRMKRAKKRQQFAERMQNYMEEERLKGILEREITLSSGNTVVEESEVESADSQQVQVIVHRSVSLSEPGAESTTAEECELYANRFTADGTDVVIEPEAGESDDGSVIFISDFKEVMNDGGYPTVVANIVSKVNHRIEQQDIRDNDDEVDSEEKTESVNDEGRGESICVHLSLGEESGESIPKEAYCTTDSAVEAFSEDSSDCDSLEGSETCDASFDKPPAPPSKNLETMLLVTEDVIKISIEDNKSSKPDGKISPKDSLPGCFGTMFSRCSQIASTSSESLAPKNHLPGTDALYLHKKSSTWEKVRSSKVDNILTFGHPGNCADQSSAPCQPDACLTCCPLPETVRLSNRNKSHTDLKDCRAVSLSECFKTQSLSSAHLHTCQDNPPTSNGPEYLANDDVIHVPQHSIITRL